MYVLVLRNTVLLNYMNYVRLSAFADSIKVIEVLAIMAS